MKVNTVGLKWFTKSPDAGMSECICSDCGLLITEDEIPIRLFSSDKKREIRLHDKCFKKRVKE